jgi:hypothetical protein
LTLPPLPGALVASLLVQTHRKIFLATSVLALGGLATFLATRKMWGESPTGVFVASATKQPVSTNHPHPFAVPLNAGFSEQGTAKRPASASLNKLLPSIREDVNDWRTFNPDSVTVATGSGAGQTYYRSKHYTEAGNGVWVGRNSQQGAFLAMVGSKEEAHVVIENPRMQGYEISVSKGEARLIEMPRDVGIAGCGVGLDEETDAGHAHVHGPSCIHGLAAATAASTVNAPVAEVAAATSGPALAAGEVPTVDVVFFYTTSGRTSTNPSDWEVLESLPALGMTESTFILRVQTHLVSCNSVLENSQVNEFRWRYVGIYPLPTEYFSVKRAARDSTSADIAAMKSPTSVIGPFVQQKIAETGADQACMYTYFGDVLGRGEMPGRYSVIANTFTSYSLMAHELGHNFGCNHDRDTTTGGGASGAVDGDGKYNYGYQKSTTLLGSRHGTIMSYPNDYVPYFSNPNLTYTVVSPTNPNNTEVIPLGVAVGQPRAAHNARVLSENAVRMSDQNSAIKITSQPVSQSVVRGNGFTLSVTATGTALTYQWRKGGATIAGATASSLAVSGAADADAGSYDVVLTNSLTSVTSSPATIIVTNTPPPAPPATGGGGGGGGSHSLLYLILLTAAAALRGKRR